MELSLFCRSLMLLESSVCEQARTLCIVLGFALYGFAEVDAQGKVQCHCLARQLETLNVGFKEECKE